MQLRHLFRLADSGSIFLVAVLFVFGGSVSSCGPTAPLTSHQNGDLKHGAVTFTVVSYNVENFFDQSDDKRNASYGDYRIRPNSAGQSSNYGAEVALDGKMTNFTDVKARGIAQVLRAIDPRGPEVVALLEVESPQALAVLNLNISDLGYKSSIFSGWNPGQPELAIGFAFLSKYPIQDKLLLDPIFPTQTSAQSHDPLRPIMRVTLDVLGKPLYVYVNHWKAKSGPESLRMASAETVRQDIESLKSRHPSVDYIVLGDLNSEYNEAQVMEPDHDDTKGRTGINDVLRAQGDESKVRSPSGEFITYDLLYELPSDSRRTEASEKFGWSALDHMIVGSGLYDGAGVGYVDNSFAIPTPSQPGVGFLFDRDGMTKRWRGNRLSNKYTKHEVGGYSDHLPIYARFSVSP